MLNYQMVTTNYRSIWEAKPLNWPWILEKLSGAVPAKEIKGQFLTPIHAKKSQDSEKRSTTRQVVGLFFAYFLSCPRPAIESKLKSIESKLNPIEARLKCIEQPLKVK